MGDKLRILPGKPHPLGATPDKSGVNFSVFSKNATSVELLIFDKKNPSMPIKTVKLDPKVNLTYNFWHVFVAGLKPGNLYAYRVDGPYDPDNGLIFNKNKVIIDPYAKGIDYSVWERADAYTPNDNLKTSLRGIIVDDKKYNWGGDKPLNLPLSKTIIYEIHVGNFTKSPNSKCKLRGTFKGVIEKIPYLKSIGITAVELMPIFDFSSGDEKNVWGYGSLSFFAPEMRYCTNKNNPINDFRDMVKALHKAGIEVILDVVFGYTTEKGENGPYLSYKGFDNSVYYMLMPDKKYMNFSGCGNTLNCNHPVVSKLILDCLEYWVEEMHVDGFRFDEASLLSRDESGNILHYPHLLWNIDLSEKLANTKIFAEPWDAGGGYLLGKFPGYRFIEWNGRFRDDIRRFIKGEDNLTAPAIMRISGSPDLYDLSKRCPLSSLNFITAHDGFTLNDLVSYEQKHNEENCENNCDGFDQNFSWNCGIEGETDDPVILKNRLKNMKNLMAILILSKGIPLITMGDEVARTQKGNNNPYCQDNKNSWFDWDLVHKNSYFLHFFKTLIELRRENADLLGSMEISGGEEKEVIVFRDCKFDLLENTANIKLFSFTIDNKIHAMVNMEDIGQMFNISNLDKKNWYLAVNTNNFGPIGMTTKEKELLELENFYVESHSIVVMAVK